MEDPLRRKPIKPPSYRELTPLKEFKPRDTKPTEESTRQRCVDNGREQELAAMAINANLHMAFMS